AVGIAGVAGGTVGAPAGRMVPSGCHASEPSSHDKAVVSILPEARRFVISSKLYGPCTSSLWSVTKYFIAGRGWNCGEHARGIVFPWGGVIYGNMLAKARGRSASAAAEQLC